MSFASPAVLLALLAIPLLILWYAGQQRRRVRAEASFVAAPLAPSVAPHRPRWRRHLPMLVFMVAIAVLIVGAARPQRTVAAPVGNAAIMLADDISSSMNATDVKPSRIDAARAAAQRFLATVPSTVKVGMLEFARHPTVLQAPTADHALVQAALTQRPQTSGGTAIGDALQTAITLIRSLPAQNGKRPPGAILLLSDGASNAGSDPIAAARLAAADHIPVYTFELGTPNGTIEIKRGNRLVNTPVPTSPAQLAAVARVSGGQGFTISDATQLKEVYTKLANQLSHKKVKHEITEGFAGGGLALLLLGGALSLLWFGRLV
jgi:Ca-activated chloride channel family protein